MIERQPMRIGELAQASATPVETIRFYEREGLLPAAARTEANYRIYTPQHAERLAFVRQCRSLDMTLDEVRLLLRFKDQPQADCGAVNHLLDAHIGHVAERIQALQALELELRALRAACPAPHAAADCGILQGIDQAGARPAVTPKRHVRGAH
jgi:Cd(II)/Pb(II)-responsive transcriptional regulator